MQHNLFVCHVSILPLHQIPWNFLLNVSCWEVFHVTLLTGLQIFLTIIFNNKCKKQQNKNHKNRIRTIYFYDNFHFYCFMR